MKVELLNDLPRKLDVRNLVFAYRDKKLATLSPINHYVSGLQNWISKKPIHVQVFVPYVCELFLVCRLALQLAQRRHHGQQQMQFRMFRNQGLQKNHALCRIERSEEHTSELQSHLNLVCRLLLEKKKKIKMKTEYKHR